VTTASDVYALGLLLYRLLSGQPAYAIRPDAPLPELQRLICQDMPTRPSSALARSSASLSDPASKRQVRRLRGDLDTIVLKALRKEPERRYGSVEELAEDLRRLREGLPVLARPDTPGYRASKFIRRHWAGLAATSAAFLALSIGMGVAIFQAEQARSERDRTEQVNRFLQTILLEADPYQAGEEATVRDVLRKAGEMVGDRFSDQTDIEAALRYTIGYTQLSLMALAESRDNLVRAETLLRQLYGDSDDRTLMAQAYLAWLDFRRDDHAQAEAGYRRVLARLNERHEVATRATVHNDFGVILAELERWDEALEHQHFALELWLAHDPDRSEIGVAYNNIAYNLHGKGELEQARQWYEKALERQRAEAPNGLSPDLASNLNNLGILLRDLGLPDEALPYYRESVEMRIATLGADHAFTGFGHLNLGRLLLDLDRPEEARTELESAVHISTATLEPEHTQVLVARSSLARAKALTGEPERARAIFDEIIPVMREQRIPASFLEQAIRWQDALDPA
jgi:eukaryotic-like serine/threonine-protein kinase